MFNLSSTIRRFNRFELKYLISIQQAEQIKSALRAYLVADEYGNENGYYKVSSLYYDSPDFLCYWEKIDGVKFRRKLRIRHYETDKPLTQEKMVFVEIKQRIDRVTQKRRVLLPYSDALDLCNNRQIPEHKPEDKETIEEIFSFLWQYNLRPASIVRYKRQALIGTEYDVGLRVTFDTSITSQSNHLKLHETPSDVLILRPNRVVMEIKVNERIPYWLTELVATHNLQAIRISKYCRSIEVTNNFSSTHSHFTLSSF